ncbi:hypothetical protein EDC01DRAFT_785961 [Geopyxis carbonaria]|nr:hypothetical protein EDC01DRAFT_785961 [Geopyxis carbonaria]
MTVPVSNSYALLTGLVLSTILQPRGSFIFPYSHSYFWRPSGCQDNGESVCVRAGGVVGADAAPSRLQQRHTSLDDADDDDADDDDAGWNRTGQPDDMGWQALCDAAKLGTT